MGETRNTKKFLSGNFSEHSHLEERRRKGNSKLGLRKISQHFVDWNKLVWAINERILNKAVTAYFKVLSQNLAGQT
jgi:hypothetical protein